MEYKVLVDSIYFIFNESLFENEVKRLLLRYKYSNSCFLSLIILDNNDARKYLVKRLKENIDNIHDLDFSKKDSKLNDISKYIKQDKVPVIAYNLEGFYSKVGEEYDKVATDLSGEIFYSEFKKRFTDLVDMGQYLVYTGINMARDSVFLEYNGIFFLVLSDKDYLDFIGDRADDFVSYCQVKVDFNSCFINKDNISLSEYYQEKNLSKVLRKKKVD